MVKTEELDKTDNSMIFIEMLNDNPVKAYPEVYMETLEKAMQERNVDDVQIAYQVGEKYFAIQTVEDGYDYTFSEIYHSELDVMAQELFEDVSECVIDKQAFEVLYIGQE